MTNKTNIVKNTGSERRGTMKKLTKKMPAVLMSLVMAASIPGAVFAETTDNQPTAPVRPQVESYKDNNTIKDYNSAVDEYNKEAAGYNLAVDEEYSRAVEETNRKNEEIRLHNEAEEQRVKEAEARNEQAKKDAEEANRRIDAENAAEQERVNKHNAEEDQKVNASKEAKAAAEAENEKISKHNDAERQKELEYNANVDKEYADAVEAERVRIEKIKARNEEIRKNNADEDQKVKDTADMNEKEKARIEQANKEKEEQYLEDVAKYNADKEQYKADYAQYQNDLVIEQKIKKLGYASVEQYNEMINRHYNEPAKKSVQKNAEAAELTVKDTYSVQEAAVKSGRMIKVTIEHTFEGTDKKYTEEFEIDANDIITFSPMASFAESTNPGYASFYYNTDDNHQMGYWCEAMSSIGTNANYHNSGWNCGDTHEISFKDGKRHAYDTEDIVVEYNYTWIPQKVYKTYNTPVEPTEPTAPVLELENFEPVTYVPTYLDELDETENTITRGAYYTPDLKDLIDVPSLYTAAYETFNPAAHVEAMLEDIPEADILDTLPDPVKKAYMSLLQHMALFAMPASTSHNTTVDPNGTTPAPAAVLTPALTPAAETAQSAEVIEDAAAPLASIDESPVPLAMSTDKAAEAETEGAWALINLIATILTALISALMIIFRFVGRKNDEDEEEEITVNNKTALRLFGLIPVIAAVTAFNLTEDMTLKMQMVDKWTVLMILILAVEAVTAVLAKKTTEQEEKEEEETKAIAA